MKKTLNIVVPMAGAGSRFATAGYSFPKPLIEIGGKPMIQHVIDNLRPKVDYRFIFICQTEHFNKYSLSQIFRNLTNGRYQAIQISALTQGAACTVLTAVDLINSEDDLIIANSDQLVDIDFDNFISFCRKPGQNGTIMTFPSSHPKWSYARLDKQKFVIETVEKKVVSDQATVGIYYFARGSDFVSSACKMISKNIRVNHEFYVCPVYNEMILNNQKISVYPIPASKMHGLGTPEDLNAYLKLFEKHEKHSKKT